MPGKRVAAHPRLPDKPVLPRARRAPTHVSTATRATPPDAWWGLWELPGGFGVTQLK